MAEPHIQEIAKRFACAYTSYVAGHSGVDYLLKRTKDEDVGTFWVDLADFVFYAMKHRDEPGGQKFRRIVSKYIH